MTLAPLATAVIVLVCITAAWLDLRTHRIPDALTLSATAAGLFFTGAAGVRALALRLLLVVVVAILAITLHALGVWGGGDGKLVIAIAAWKGLWFVAIATVATFLIGGLLAAFLLLWRRRPGTSIAFGPLIAAGTAVAALLEIFRS